MSGSGSGSPNGSVRSWDSTAAALIALGAVGVAAVGIVVTAVLVVSHEPVGNASAVVPTIPITTRCPPRRLHDSNDRTHHRAGPLGGAAGRLVTHHHDNRRTQHDNARADDARNQH